MSWISVARSARDRAPRACGRAARSISARIRRTSVLGFMVTTTRSNGRFPVPSSRARTCRTPGSVASSPSTAPVKARAFTRTRPKVSSTTYRPGRFPVDFCSHSQASASRTTRPVTAPATGQNHTCSAAKERFCAVSPYRAATSSPNTPRPASSATAPPPRHTSPNRTNTTRFSRSTPGVNGCLRGRDIFADPVGSIMLTSSG